MDNCSRLKGVGAAAAVMVGLSNSVALASDPAHPRGSMLGWGNATQDGTLDRSAAQPAGPIARANRGVRMGVLGVGIAAEIGDVDDFGDDFEAIGDDLDDLEDTIDRIEAGDFDDPEELVGAIELMQSVDRRANDLLVDLNEDGYLSLGVRGNHAPFPLELTNDWLRGSLTLDLDYQIRAQVDVLADERLRTPFGDLSTDPGDYEVDGEGNITFEEQNLEDWIAEREVNTEEFGGYVRGMQRRTFALGYVSRPD